MFENAEIVKTGKWIYGKTQLCSLRIIKWDTMYGSGDYEDEPEVRDDKDIECYYVVYDAIADRMGGSSSAGFLTITEAQKEAERAVNQKIMWDEIL